MKLAISLIVIILFLFLTTQTFSQFTYTDFSSIEGLKLVVNASQYQNKIRVTPSSSQKRGAVWYRTKQYIQNGFETTFQFQFTGQGGISPAGADGIAFVIQVVNDSVISTSAGGGIGYLGITNSLAIEFDTWPNGEFADPNGNHISVQTRGLIANSPHHNYSLGSTTAIPNLKNQSIYTAKIKYSGTQLIIFLNDLNNPVLTVNVNLATTLALDQGKAWIGFTSATGNSYENHDLISWSFTPVPLVGLELSAPYTEESEFYSRIPQPLNKFLFNIRITAPTLPSPPLESITLTGTLDGNPLTLQLNSSLVTLDSDNNGIIDQLPAAQKPNLNYIEFIAESNVYTTNQLNKNLSVSITSIDGDPVNINASDVVSLYFAKQGSNVYSLTRDAYDFGNSSELKWTDFLKLIYSYGLKKGFWIYLKLQEYISMTQGRCYGMTITSGSYFLYPFLKPWVGDVHDWSSLNPIVSEKINLAHISQVLYKRTSNVDSSYDKLSAFLDMQHPVNLAIGDPISQDVVAKHSVLAIGMTKFNSVGNAYVNLYEPNKPNESFTATLHFSATPTFNYNATYGTTTYNFELIHACDQNWFLNWGDFEYNINKWLHKENKILFEKNEKTFAIACPVNLLVTNSQGLKVGYLANGIYINEIPNAVVQRAPTNDAVGDSVTVISVPLNDEYELVMNSFGNGNLVFEHLEPVDSTILFTAASDTIPITSQTILHFEETDSTHLYVDIDGNGTIDSTVNLTYTLLNLPLPGTINSNINQGWNLISNPVTRQANTDSVRQLYPNSEYTYVYKFGTGTGYQQTYTMPNGLGFWGKFPNSGTNFIEGGVRDLDTIEVSTGWNLVGSISVAIDTSTIISIPPGIRVSNWFGFTGGYNITNQITPGSAYWIKTNADGKFVLSVGDQINKSQKGRENILDRFSSITIADGSGSSQTLYFGVDAKKEIIESFFEMPPLPPVGIFDARFRTDSGDYILLTHSKEVENQIEFPIIIQSQNSSLSISWNIKNGEMYYELTDGMNGKFFEPKMMVGQGTIQLSNIKSIALKVLGEQYIPTKLSLEQNYPNPFNPITNIKFAIPKEVQVNLIIYSILGEKVKELKNEILKPGFYEVEFDASALASGIYFYRIQAGDFVDTKKMMLLK